LPRQYRVERSATMQAAPDAVFAQVGDLRRWAAWGIWYERDPEMKITYSDVTDAVGSWNAWTSATQGNGKMVITARQAPQTLVYRIEFPDYKMEATGTLTLTPIEGGAVRVVWTDEGDLGTNPVNRWFGLFMDRMVGGDFAASLAKLRDLVEKKP
jgi:hypothetical protein